MNAPQAIMFVLDGEFDSDPGAFYFYTDYRLDDPERGPFYHGIGGRSRVKKVNRQEDGSHHRNIARKHGILRKFQAVGTGDSGWDECCRLEIAAIAESRLAGFKLANRTAGGDGARGVVTLVNRTTGESISWPKDQEWPAGFEHATKGKVSLVNRVSGESICWPKDQEWPDGFEGTRKGVRLSEETKAKLSASLKEALSRPDAKAKLSASMKEALSRPETKAKLSASVKELWSRPDAKAKLSASMKAAAARGHDAGVVDFVREMLIAHPNLPNYELIRMSLEIRPSANKGTLSRQFTEQRTKMGLEQSERLAA